MPSQKQSRLRCLRMAQPKMRCSERSSSWKPRPKWTSGYRRLDCGRRSKVLAHSTTLTDGDVGHVAWIICL
jgi:hypothetical protein